jgi:hypothetical protein
VSAPVPTPIYRILHVGNLSIYLQRGALHAPLHTPSDGLAYQTIHNVQIQKKRRARSIPCGPGGVIHDYVSFYFGPRSPMLFQLHTGQVQGYTQGQEPLIYLVSKAQAVTGSGAGFVFSDGQGIAAYTGWFDDLTDLVRVDWEIVNGKFWNDTPDHPDRQRRKQAEFLVHQRCDWALVHEIGVLNEKMKAHVVGILAGYPAALHRPVIVRPQWYY